MEKFQVWVDLKDRRYAKRLVDFLVLRYCDTMQVELWDRAKGRMDFDCILLTDREERKEEYGQVIWVSVEEGLNPFQSGHKIAREILKRKETWHLREEVCEFQRKQGEWISVYSPIGGIGKSTLAMALANILAANHKVLFLSLEGPSAWNVFFQYPLQYNLSDFFYCFLMGNPKEWTKMTEEMLYQQKNGLYFIPPCSYPDDMLELRDEEVISWMAMLREKFDYVITDMGCQMIRPHRVILKNSNRQCFIIDARIEGHSKWQNFAIELEGMNGQWVFRRYEEKGRQGEIFLPEDDAIFEFQDGIKQYSINSMYYKGLEKVVSEWK